MENAVLIASKIVSEVRFIVGGLLFLSIILILTNSNPVKTLGAMLWVPWENIQLATRR
jgi:hypothetical protein